MTFDFPNVSGWVGMILLLAAYAGRHRLSSLQYSMANLLGAAGLAVLTFAQAAWPAFALQVIWGLIAIRDLTRVSSTGSDGSPA